MLAASAGAIAVAHAGPASPPDSTTAIKHVVVIFDENQSFDHYFATYPHAANPAGQPAFTGSIGVQTVDNLETAGLLAGNPNSRQPRRLDRSEAVTCDFNHNYNAEQLAFHNGAMDRFPENTDTGGCVDRTVVMSYYDGNTVTGLWNYAQHFAISDRFFGTTFGPSTIGAINLISGNTHGVSPVGAGVAGTMIANSQPLFDDCAGAATASFAGRNVSDLMNDHGVTWGWFAGGFKPTSRSGATAVCAGTHTNAAGANVGDYLPHHMPFQYYASTANQHHLPPTSVAAIGTTDQANHQYDLTDFDATLAAGNLPQVSFLKPVAAEDAHPGYSGPLDEQHFMVRTLNALQQSPEWSSTAVFIAYDDADGWYDHAFITPQQGSDTASDALSGAGACGPAPAAGDYRGRCGPGPRLPFLVISPYAKQNYIDHTQLEQTSILRFIEDNWGLGRIGDQSFDARAASLNAMFNFGAGGSAPKLILDSATGAVATPTPTPTPTATPTATATATATSPPVASTATAAPIATASPAATPRPVATAAPKAAAVVKIQFSRGFKISPIPRKKGCTGKLTLQLKLGKKVLDTAATKLSSQCTFKATFSVKRAALGKATKLKVYVRFHGNHYLDPNTTTFTVLVPKQ